MGHGHAHGGGHGHSHGGGIPAGSAAGRNKGRLAWALALTLTYMAAEVVGGLLTGSLALLADAAHMVTDAGGLALSLLAIHYAAKAPSPGKSFGYMRFEILAALANAVVLLGVTAYILYEAYRRFFEPTEILGWPMMLVAFVGLGVNLASMRLLAGGSSESLNVKGAYFEVFSDMLGSVGVIAAALVVMATGWRWVDPLVGAGIGLFIVPRTWRLLSEALHILLEGTPLGVDLAALRTEIEAMPGVRRAYDLHAWTLTSGFDAMSGHVVMDDVAAGPDLIRAVRRLVKERHGIEHVTVQVEDEALSAEAARLPV
ncbi:MULTISPECIES: cation diffusion facilitator family transporter [Methylobacterium]|jgi:cobalt-zinc-cadmium efflux system protein|uniref:Cobalt-zinc-cadmium efflux system protein n=6 Tax=Pseudomonadota TaxID=1224 RepID=A0AAJ1TJ14_9HYPH|nr:MULTISPECIES: cation diffusion facilitator family transporter [Methylobacterium]AWV14195.1 cation transporter [Methylobacterium sp. XJLW]EIZ84254.1 cation diffusion facilitator family transporter [Methylobacterium sp. GXF4]KNY22598.1 cation transporter [Methylobacterium sp. ARG-1]MBP31918.1 cation transporter [Methylobacterium sp.]MCB4800688.1 cation diffusion facilitator family transporter [Methylobacterium brachiatum]